MLLFRKTIWNDRKLRGKIVEMATEFCLEASVLISVLGILDSAIAAGGWPRFRVFLLSLGFGVFFFACGCIIQAGAVEPAVAHRTETTEEGSLDSGSD